MASSGNGVDLGHVVAMLQDVMEGQRTIIQSQHSLIDSNREIRTVLADQGRRLERVEGRLDRVDGGLDLLREAVTMYHASVLGHGVLISELDARVRRIEHHLNLPPAA